MASKENFLRIYPNLANPKLPLIIGCLQEHDKTEAQQDFKRVCFRDVRIAAVEPVTSNTRPTCIWRVYYQLKHKDIELEHGDSTSSSDILPPELPEDEESLKKLYEDITETAAFLGMNVLRKFQAQDRFTAIVEFSPRKCQCVNKDFKMVTENPRRWPKITEEVQITLSHMKIDM